MACDLVDLQNHHERAKTIDVVVLSCCLSVVAIDGIAPVMQKMYKCIWEKDWRL